MSYNIDYDGDFIINGIIPLDDIKDYVALGLPADSDVANVLNNSPLEPAVYCSNGKVPKWLTSSKIPFEVSDSFDLKETYFRADYDSDCPHEWIVLLIEYYCKKNNLLMNGMMYWYGEEREDIGRVRVKDNIMTFSYANITYGEVPFKCSFCRRELSEVTTQAIVSWKRVPRGTFCNDECWEEYEELVRVNKTY